MTDNVNINAYEGLTSNQQLNLFKNLYYNDGFSTEKGIMANAINDILSKYHKQQAEIERLTKSLELVKGAKCVYSYDGETLEYCVHSPCPICKTADQIKSEAYKEFANKVVYDINAYCEKNIRTKPSVDGVTGMKIANDLIYKRLNEMEGKNNGNS